MSILLYRVDDRLVHGQVVVGWGGPLMIARIVLVDDLVASSPWERDLYRMGVPRDTELVISGVEEAVERLPAWQSDETRSLLLTGEIPTMAALCRGAGAITRVNLGGIHHRPGRLERLPYIYLTDEEYRLLTALAAEGVEISAQDLPTTAPMPLERLG